MLFDIKKIFDSFYKKNKALTVALVFVVVALLVEIVWYEYRTATKTLSITQDIAIRNASKIKIIEKQIFTQDTFASASVKRTSFNAYITRKDDEYHEQMAINNRVYLKLGMLDGKISMFFDIFNTLDFAVKCQESDSC